MRSILDLDDVTSKFLSCPFKECQQQFRRKQDLDSHITAHQRNSFNCRACNQIFISKQSFLYHWKDEAHMENNHRYNSERRNKKNTDHNEAGLFVFKFIGFFDELK